MARVLAQGANPLVEHPGRMFLMAVGVALVVALVLKIWDNR